MSKAFRWNDVQRVIKAVAPDYPESLKQFIGFLDSVVWLSTGALEIMYNEWFLQNYIRRRQIDRFAYKKLIGCAAVLTWCAKWKTWTGTRQTMMEAITDFLGSLIPGASIIFGINKIEVTAGNLSRPDPPRPVTNSEAKPFFDISVPGYIDKRR